MHQTISYVLEIGIWLVPIGAALAVIVVMRWWLVYAMPLFEEQMKRMRSNE